MAAIRRERTKTIKIVFTKNKTLKAQVQCFLSPLPASWLQAARRIPGPVEHSAVRVALQLSTVGLPAQLWTVRVLLQQSPVRELPEHSFVRIRRQRDLRPGHSRSQCRRPMESLGALKIQPRRPALDARMP